MHTYIYACVCLCACIGEHINTYLLNITLLFYMYRYNSVFFRDCALLPSSKASFLALLPSSRYHTNTQDKWSNSAPRHSDCIFPCLHAGCVNIGIIFIHFPLLIWLHNSKAGSVFLDEIFTQAEVCMLGDFGYCDDSVSCIQ